ncbi:MAG: hypothetical protein WC966_01860 [Bradymonadales bacterium]
MKLLSRLFVPALAFAALSFFGCDDSGSKCKTGEKKCEGAKIGTCISGSFVVTDCADGLTCQNANCVCANDTKSCDGDKLVTCEKGKAKKTETCTAGCENNACKDTSTCPSTKGNVGDCCVRGEYTATCTNDGANALVCIEGKVAEWTCHENQCATKADNPKEVDCPKVPDTECTLPSPGTTSNTYANGDACPTELSNVKGLCAADKSKGYYCAKDGDTRVVRVKDCANNDCSLDPTAGSTCGHVLCGQATECQQPPVTEAGNVGQCCNRNNYKQTCTNGGANALVCWNDAVTQWNCKDDACTTTADPNKVDCPNPGPSECTLPNPGTTDSTYTEGENCPAELNSVKGLCATDGSKGYYCSGTGTARVVNVKLCSNNDCTLNPNAGQYCGYVECGEPGTDECTQPPVTEGGEIGQCCDQSTYEPSGCVENKGTRCSSKGKVAEWTCNADETCSYDASKKWYECVKN